MPKKRHKPEEIVAKLRQVDVLVSQGQSVADAVRAIGVTEVTYYRWRQEYGGLKSDQVKRLKCVGTRISMDAKRRCLDNIFIERLSRCLKYECVYLDALEPDRSPRPAPTVGPPFAANRPHSAHRGGPPAVVSFNWIETNQQG